LIVGRDDRPLAAQVAAPPPHPFTAADQKAGFRHDISILQAEFSLTQMLDRPVHGRLFFEPGARPAVFRTGDPREGLGAQPEFA
jgi:hypothetical protein